jgi:hypothetical protein
MSPWKAPVALTIENELSAVEGVLGTGPAFVSWIVIDPVAVDRVKDSVDEVWPIGLTSFTSVPVTETWPKPVIVPEPWKVVVVPALLFVPELIVVTNVPESVPFSNST